ncbi:unnamed protein product [Adineta steineri]|nr:unnamed protein product [Adineta steineri]
MESIQSSTLHMPTILNDSLPVRRSSLAYSSIKQNFVLVWLDHNMDKINNKKYYEIITTLKSIVYTIDKFDNIRECMNFLNEIKNEKIFLIVSDNLGQHIIPRIHHMCQLDSIYILNRNTSQNIQWITGWWKIQGIHKQITSMYKSLKKAAQRCDYNSISMSFVPIDENNDTEIDHTFMYTQILKEILFEIEYDEESIRDFTTYSRECNYGDFNIIDKFRQEYDCQKPIWWYTYPCFLSSILNRALRTLEIDTLIKLGFFICDLNRNIKQLHNEQLHSRSMEPFIVYRGQGIPKNRFEKLIKTKNGLMSFNNFLSTSTDKQVSLAFTESNRDNPDMVGILFQMTIDPSVLSTPFAYVNDIGYYKGQEQEILFSMHTLFRIVDIKPYENDNRIWLVELKAINDTDHRLNKLTKNIRLETRGSTGWDRLGRLLLKLDQFNKAEQVYKQLLNQTSTDIKKAYIYNQLGKTKNHQGNYMDAILYFRKALKIHENTFPSHQISLASCYNNIGQMYQRMGEYPKALLFHRIALDIKQDILPLDHIDLAESYGHIGLLYEKLGEHHKALLSHKKALRIRQKKLPNNHPSLAHSYKNIASVYNNMGKYSKALIFYNKSHAIMEDILPSNHSDLAQSYGHIGLLLNKLGDYSKALLYHEKAFEIRRKILPENHPFLANSHNNIGSVYNSMGKYSKALKEYKEALKINLTTFPLNHPHIGTSYHNLATVYMNLGERSKALSLYRKALAIYTKTLSSNHLVLATIHSSIGLLYYYMGNYTEALSYYEKAIQLYQNALLLNHPYLTTLYNNIGLTYLAMGSYSKALLSHQKALEIKQKIFSSNHSTIAISYKNIGNVYFEMKEYSKALSSYENALKIRKKNIPFDNNILINYYNSIGLTYLHMNEHAKALSCYEKAISICYKTHLPDYSEMAKSYYNIGCVHLKEKKYSNAFPYFYRARDIAQATFPANHPSVRQYQKKLVNFQYENPSSYIFI